MALTRLRDCLGEAEAFHPLYGNPRGRGAKALEGIYPAVSVGYDVLCRLPMQHPGCTPPYQGVGRPLASRTTQTTSCSAEPVSAGRPASLAVGLDGPSKRARRRDRRTADAGPWGSGAKKARGPAGLGVPRPVGPTPQIRDQAQGALADPASRRGPCMSPRLLSTPIALECPPSAEPLSGLAAGPDLGITGRFPGRLRIRRPPTIGRTSG